jgi:3-dehydroquinate dehydratase type I
VAGARHRICAAIVAADLPAIRKVEAMVDLFEVRIDLIGSDWRDVAGGLKKPWIACNRRAEEGGKWRGSESDRIGELRHALELGADYIDIELATANIARMVNEARGKAQCIVSYHDMKGTPPIKELKKVLERERDAGADICKVVTTARSFADNLTVLQLIKEFPTTKVVAFAMGPGGQISRVLGPLAGGYFTYASIKEGRESAEGQIAVTELRKIYGMLKK